jgi:hypothetical protein
MYRFRIDNTIHAWSLEQVPTLQASRETRLAWQLGALRNRVLERSGL